MIGSGSLSDEGSHIRFKSVEYHNNPHKMVNQMSLMRTPDLTGAQWKLARQLRSRVVKTANPFFVGAGLGVLIDTIQCDPNFTDPKHLASYAAGGCVGALLISIYRKRAENHAMWVTLDTAMHKIRTPLTVIFAYTQMLTTSWGFSNRLPGDVLECLRAILKAVQMLREECDRLANVSEFKVKPDNGTPDGIKVLVVPEKE